MPRARKIAESKMGLVHIKSEEQKCVRQDHYHVLLLKVQSKCAYLTLLLLTDNELLVTR